jgi:hypothetical protein
MNWNAHPYLYQVLHPWHWVTYGQNAAAVGLIGLALYTYFTYRLFRHSQDIERAKLLPYLVLQNSNDPKTALDKVVVQNIGAPATNLVFWKTTVSHKFKFSEELVIDPYAHLSFEGSMLRDGTREIDVSAEKPGERYLYVFEMSDVARGFHQFGFLRTRTLDNLEISTMAHMLHTQLRRTLRSSLRQRFYAYQAKKLIARR